MVARCVWLSAAGVLLLGGLVGACGDDSPHAPADGGVGARRRGTREPGGAGGRRRGGMAGGGTGGRGSPSPLPAPAIAAGARQLVRIRRLVLVQPAARAATGCRRWPAPAGLTSGLPARLHLGAVVERAALRRRSLEHRAVAARRSPMASGPRPKTTSGSSAMTARSRRWARSRTGTASRSRSPRPSRAELLTGRVGGRRQRYLCRWRRLRRPSSRCPRCTGTETPWTPIPGVTGRRVAGSGPNDVWIAGAPTGLLHFDGTSWSRVPGWRACRSTALAAGGPGDVWLVATRRPRRPARRTSRRQRSEPELPAGRASPTMLASQRIVAPERLAGRRRRVRRRRLHQPLRRDRPGRGAERAVAAERGRPVSPASATSRSGRAARSCSWPLTRCRGSPTCGSGLGRDAGGCLRQLALGHVGGRRSGHRVALRRAGGQRRAQRDHREAE